MSAFLTKVTRFFEIELSWEDLISGVSTWQFNAKSKSRKSMTVNSEKQEECGVVAYKRLTEPRVTIEWLLKTPRSFSNLPAFLILMVEFKFEM